MKYASGVKPSSTQSIRPRASSSSTRGVVSNNKTTNSVNEANKVTQKDRDSLKPPKDLGSNSSYQPHADTKSSEEGPIYRNSDSKSARSGSNVSRGLTQKETKDGVADISNRSTAKKRAQSYSENKPRFSSRSKSADEDLQRARREEEKNRA